MKNRLVLVVLSLCCLCSPVYGQLVITTVAGSGTAGSLGDGGTATAAQLHDPNKVFVDASGNIYIAEMVHNHRIRKVNAVTGIMTTVAGNGTAGNSGDGGPATAAKIDGPSGVYANAAGDVYFTDVFRNVVRKVDAGTGVISTIAGTGTSGYTGDGGPATAATLSDPHGITGDASGNIFFTEYGSSVVRKIAAATGIITTVAGTGTSGTSADGGLAVSAKLNRPEGLFVAGNGDLYIADVSSYKVRKVDAATGIISTVAGTGTSGYSGDGGPATDAALLNATDVCLDASGNMYLADYTSNVIRKVSATGIITTIAGDGTSGYSGDGGPATAAKFDGSGGVYVRAGSIYIADAGNNVIRKVSAATGLQDVRAGNKSIFYPNPLSGVLYIPAVAGGGGYRITDITGRQIETGKLKTGDNVLPVQHIAAGTYVLEIAAQDGTATIARFVKE